MTNKNEFQLPLYITIELAGALGTEEDIKQLTEGKDNIKAFQNSDEQVAIVLPYYSYLDNISSAATLAEEDLESAAGGFFFGPYHFSNFSHIDGAVEIFGDDEQLSFHDILNRLAERNQW